MAIPSAYLVVFKINFYTDFFQPHKYALFYNSGYLFVTFSLFRA